MKSPKVLIGCPTYEIYDYCLGPYLAAVRHLDHMNADLLMVDNSPTDEFYNQLKRKGVKAERIYYVDSARERIVRSRNLLLQKAMRGGYDYFFSLEQDVIVQPDTLTRLLSHGKPIVSGYYANKRLIQIQHNKTGEMKRTMVELPLAYMRTDEGEVRRAHPGQLRNKGLVEVGAVGVGCLLIAREVFTRLRFRYDPQKESFDDMHFSEDAEKLGYKLYVDGDTIATHLHRDWRGLKK
jgi:GT2 family glycosyltransferase